MFRQYILEILPLSYSMEGTRVFALFAVGVIQQIIFLFVGTACIIKPCNLMSLCLVLLAIFFQSLRQLNTQIQMKLKGKEKIRQNGVQNR